MRILNPLEGLLEEKKQDEEREEKGNEEEGRRKEGVLVRTLFQAGGGGPHWSPHLAEGMRWIPGITSTRALILTSLRAPPF